MNAHEVVELLQARVKEAIATDMQNMKRGLPHEEYLQLCGCVKTLERIDKLLTATGRELNGGDADE